MPLFLYFTLSFLLILLSFSFVWWLTMSLIFKFNDDLYQKDENGNKIKFGNIKQYFKANRGNNAFVIVFSLFISIFASGFLSTILVLAFSGFVGAAPHYHNGKANVIVVDAWKENGLIFKTYEAKISYIVDRNASEKSLTEMRASIRDPEVFEKLNKYRGVPVVVTYNTWYCAPYWVGNSNNEITDITPIIKE